VYLSNEFHDLLVFKDATGFWKMCVSKTSPVYGITDSVAIAQRFANSFMNNGTPVHDNNYANYATLDYIRISIVTDVLPDPENIWVWPLEFRCYHVYELRYKCFPMHFR